MLTRVTTTSLSDVGGYAILADHASILHESLETRIYRTWTDHERGLALTPDKDASRNGPLRVGIGGPVGAGKTSLTEALCRYMASRISMAVITNDIYTREDAEYLIRAQALPARAD